ncbi:alpha/beta fold hydrolase [Actinophytocola sp. S1-96]|uniref:Alpha/beta fold hydrolase n=1 Tax=Actinophytocola gossypii TaxID=2812003 RepID=A0ABT2J114_9PSEU|nr:alpha/beta fold hydrolase [Actinophytocola gossypii]
MAAVLAATGMVVAPSAVQAEPTRSTIDWQPCPEAEEVDCATIPVPLNWEDPDGPTIEIGLARREATDQERRLGSILMDPGGPGGSGVASVMSRDVFTPEVTARFDVVGFDPRGINTSTQLRCDLDLSNRSLDARHPSSQAEFRELVRLNEQLHDSCREHSGELVDHVGNQNTVEDMEAIRVALGEGKLNYVGYSYGSLMGQQYAERYPDRIRAMVLDGNMDHSMRSAWDFMRTETEPVERNFVAFAEWCDTTETCALYGQDTKAVYADLRKRAKAGDLVDPETGEPVDFYALSRIAFGANTPAAWSAVAASLAALRDGTGTVSSLATAAADQAVSNPYPPIWCSDWDFDVVNYAHYAFLRAMLAKKFPNVQWSPYVDHAMTCAGDPVRTTNPQRPLDIDGAPPLVMIGNVHDPATVYRWNVTAARQSGAHLITYEGWGHTAYGNDGPSECVNDAVDAYLIELTVPERGLTCAATEEPAAADTRQRQLSGVGPYLAG